MTSAAHKLRWAGAILIVLSYAIVANFTNQSTQYPTLGVLVAIAPIMLTVIFLIWNSRHSSVWQRLKLFSVITIGMATLWLVWPQLKQHYDWVYWLEHESLQVVLLFTFARTLTTNNVPLCTQFAQIIEGDLTAEYYIYTKKVTVAWTLFFSLMILISSVLFFFYSVSAWSIFANFIYFPLVISMFIVEFLVRKYALPEAADTKFMDAINAFQSRDKNS